MQTQSHASPGRPPTWCGPYHYVSIPAALHTALHTKHVREQRLPHGAIQHPHKAGTTAADLVAQQWVLCALSTPCEDTLCSNIMSNHSMPMCHACAAAGVPSQRTGDRCCGPRQRWHQQRHCKEDAQAAGELNQGDTLNPDTQE
jgi:hypothetical protein